MRRLCNGKPPRGLQTSSHFYASREPYPKFWTRKMAVITPINFSKSREMASSLNVEGPRGVPKVGTLHVGDCLVGEQVKISEGLGLLDFDTLSSFALYAHPSDQRANQLIWTPQSIFGMQSAKIYRQKRPNFSRG